MPVESQLLDADRILGSFGIEILNNSPSPCLLFSENGDLLFYSKSAIDFFINKVDLIKTINLFDYSNSEQINLLDYCSKEKIELSFSYPSKNAPLLNKTVNSVSFNASLSAFCILNAKYYILYLDKTSSGDDELNQLIVAIKKVSAIFPDILLLTDINAKIVFISNNGKNFLDYNDEELIGLNALDLIYEADKQVASNNYNDLFKRALGPRTYRFISKSGEIKLLEVNSELIIGKSENPQGNLYAIRDVSERFEFESSLRLNEMRNRELLNNLPFRIWLKDVNGLYLTANRNFATAFNIDNNDLYGKTDFDILPIEKAEKNKIERISILNSRKSVYYESNIHENGENLWFEEFKAPVFDEKGETIGIMGYSREITDKKILEIELKESEALFKSFVSAAPDGIFISDLDGKVLFASDNAYNMFGFNDSEEISEKNIVDLLMPSFREVAKNNLNMAKSGEKTSYTEYMAQKKDGGYFWIEEIVLLIVDPADHKEKLLFIFRDITERKDYLEEQDRLLEQVSLSKIELEGALFEKNSLIEDLAASEEQAKLANAEKDKFFSIIAHDLKNPFSGFLGLTQILSESLLDLPMREMQAYTSQLQESARNLYSLLENLLEWSRAQRGSMKIEPEFSPLYYLIKNNIEIIGGKASQKDIKIENNSENIYVYADVNMLNGVLRNLISNAAKFSHRGSTIIVNGKLVGEDYVLISVKDNGVGIEPENIPKLFRIDEKLSTEGTEGEPSTGLGLLLCKEFIDKHNGKIWAESEVGKGSEFFFTLPYKNPEMELE